MLPLKLKALKRQDVKKERINGMMQILKKLKKSFKEKHLKDNYANVWLSTLNKLIKNAVLTVLPRVKEYFCRRNNKSFQL